VHTFVAVYEGILDNDSAPVGGGELLRLAPGLPETACIPDVVVWADAARHSQHMAGEKVLGAAEVGVRCVCLLVARGEEHFGGGDEEDLDAPSLSSCGPASLRSSRRLTWC
jgi:hypothetical protein